MNHDDVAVLVGQEEAEGEKHISNKLMRSEDTLLSDLKDLCYFSPSRLAFIRYHTNP
jgi:hypothetical protein